MLLSVLLFLPFIYLLDNFCFIIAIKRITYLVCKCAEGNYSL